MIEKYLTAAVSLALTAYYIHKSKPAKTCPSNYLLYAALMAIIATINEILTKTALTTLVPVIEESYKIIASKLTPAKNQYILSGAVFGTVEMLAYTATIPTKEMFLTRATVLYIHPTSMLIYSYLKEKTNPTAGFFGAVTYHGLWNLLIVMYPWKSAEIGAIYLLVSTLMATTLTDRTTRGEVGHQ